MAMPDLSAGTGAALLQNSLTERAGGLWLKIVEVGNHSLRLPAPVGIVCQLAQYAGGVFRERIIRQALAVDCAGVAHFIAIHDAGEDWFSGATTDACRCHTRRDAARNGGDVGEAARLDEGPHLGGDERDVQGVGHGRRLPRENVTG